MIDPHDSRNTTVCLSPISDRFNELLGHLNYIVMSFSAWPLKIPVRRARTGKWHATARPGFHSATIKFVVTIKKKSGCYRSGFYWRFGWLAQAWLTVKIQVWPSVFFPGRIIFLSSLLCRTGDYFSALFRMSFDIVLHFYGTEPLLLNYTDK